MRDIFLSLDEVEFNAHLRCIIEESMADEGLKLNDEQMHHFLRAVERALKEWRRNQK